MLLTPRPQENGVDTAVQCIYRDLEYATNLIKAKAGKNQTRREAAKGTAGAAADGSGAADELDDDEEESWTFVGGDAETIDDLSADAVMKRTVQDVSATLAESRRKALGSKVLGGAAGTGAMGLSVKQI